MAPHPERPAHPGVAMSCPSPLRCAGRWRAVWPWRPPPRRVACRPSKAKTPPWAASGGQRKHRASIRNWAGRRNGDFSRGNYDDDAASLDRVPLPPAAGFALDLHQGKRRQCRCLAGVQQQQRPAQPLQRGAVSPRSAGTRATTCWAWWCHGRGPEGRLRPYTSESKAKRCRRHHARGQPALAYQAESGLGAWRPGLAVDHPHPR